MTNRVIMRIQDGQGYAPDQVTESITLRDLADRVEQAIEDHGEDAFIVLDNGDRYGATFGGLPQREDLFSFPESSDDEEEY